MKGDTENSIINFNPREEKILSYQHVITAEKSKDEIDIRTLNLLAKNPPLAKY